MKNFLRSRQTVGLTGVKCYLCHIVFSEPPGNKLLEKSENLQKTKFQKFCFFSITKQLFAKLLSLAKVSS